jgi:hypothetical protein
MVKMGEMYEALCSWENLLLAHCKAAENVVHQARAAGDEAKP